MATCEYAINIFLKQLLLCFWAPSRQSKKQVPVRLYHIYDTTFHDRWDRAACMGMGDEGWWGRGMAEC